MTRWMAGAAALFAGNVAWAQVDDALVWIGGDTWTGDRGDLYVAAFTAAGAASVQYSFDRYSALPGPTDPPANGFTIDSNGAQWNTEDGATDATPYTPGTSPSPQGVWSPHVLAGVSPAVGLFDIETGHDDAIYTLDVEGRVISLRPPSLSEVEMQVPLSATESVQALEISETHAYVFVYESVSHDTTIYRQRLGSPEPMTVVASGAPYQAMALASDGALILADIEYDGGVVRAGTITRTGGSGPTWSVPLDKPIIDMFVMGDLLWALDEAGWVYQLDTATGASTPAAGVQGPTALFDSGVPGPISFLRGVHRAEEDYVAPVDQCPSDPDKFLPGECGCDYADVPTQSFASEPDGFACVHRTATVNLNSFLGVGARIEAYAELALFAEVADGALVGERAYVGEESYIGFDAVLGRRVQIGDCVHVDDEAVLARGVTVGDGARILAFSAIGYGVAVSAGSEIGENATLGALVSFPPFDPAYVGVTGTLGIPTVVARGVSLGANSHVYTGAIIGPDTDIGPGAVVESSTRLRKQVDVGGGAYISDGARIGRGAEIGANAGIASGTNVSANAIVDPGTCPTDPVLRRGETYNTPACTEPFNTTHESNWTSEYWVNNFCLGGGPGPT